MHVDEMDSAFNEAARPMTRDERRTELEHFLEWLVDNVDADATLLLADAEGRLKQVLLGDEALWLLVDRYYEWESDQVVAVAKAV